MNNKFTPALLDSFPYTRYASGTIIQKGKEYFRAGRVYDIEFDESSVTCYVDGNYDDYEVYLTLQEGNRLQTSCTCPHASQVPICKHIVASMLTLSEMLKTDKPETLKNWERKLKSALENLPKRKTTGKARPYIAVFLLGNYQYYNNAEFYLKAGIVKTSGLPYENLQEASPEEIAEIMDKDKLWQRHFEIPYREANPDGCLNLPPAGVSILNLVLENSRYYSGYSKFSPFLPLLASMNAPLYLADRHNNFKEKIEIISDPIEVKAALLSDNKNYTMQMGAKYQGKIFSSGKNNLEIISRNPIWMLFGTYLAPLANPESLDMLSAFPIEIPHEDEASFRTDYLPKIIEYLPVESDLIAYKDVKADPLPRLYLRKEKEDLLAELRFGYGDYELRADKELAPVKLADEPDSWTLTRIHRQPESELDFYGMIKGATFGLKRAGANYDYGIFTLRARTHPYDFLTQSIPALTEAGFEIYGDKDALGKLNKNKPTISLNITSGIDWFDLDVLVHYGEQEVKLRDIRRAVKRGENYIKLADGSIGQIPDKWLDRYKHLFNMSKETEEGFRLRDYQLTMLDELLEDAEQMSIAPEFEERRNRLKDMKGIKSQPIPEGFTGELRPYQKAGLDWLRFLRDYEFGGILADDMGLGKTIQMLAFLLSEYAQAQNKSASLLVVPKSLVVNWQKESEAFTPSLRFLEYLGNDRDKDVTIFNEYDVIITTYGTMLRDVEILRGYRFHAVILDESQAIKNPLAKTSKAARVLNTKYRFAMTGTPVENNTFELWSQFAFINPGLLGNMEYFKQDFAKPIENREGEQEANLLRRMVYPFILRRTKAQVAPELPPRTERIIYTDFEPAQRKLYEKTRELYRAKLLGLLDEGGMNNARMQVLEGLLRLRQICIHPNLVEPTYSGDVAKFEILLETLETLHEEGHKALIFSQFVETLKFLEVEIKKRKIKYAYLDGKTRKRQAKVDAFQNDPAISFFLISLKAGGVGLNLTAADYVILLDPWWNPAVEMQASDRAHRIGQDKPVFVYKFIARDTVEEKILQLQARKKALVEQLISAESSFFKSLTSEDVAVLFS